MEATRRRSILFLAVLVAALSSPPAASAYEAVQVQDGGTIQGKVTYQGSVPMKKIIPTKDRETCGAIREEPEIVVGSDKGVLDAVVWLKDVQKGKALEKPKTKGEIVNRKCEFVPHVQALPVGSIVVVNDDPVMHNTHAFHGKSTVFNVALPVKGQKVERKLTKPGMNRVECDTHGWMLAWIYAAEHPYHAVTKKDGTFTLSDVPPGQYTLVAWHEFTGEQEVPVTVKAKDKTDVPVELKK
jgi:hypothetical protein